MKSLLLVLRTMGLNDIKFMIVNSQDASTSEVRQRLSDRVNGSSIGVYQDDESGSVWSNLGGNRGDILIYDRCGRLTYFIPNHLSVMSPKKPIVQTTILSAYFDNPCGRTCDETNLQVLPENITPPTAALGGSIIELTPSPVEVQSENKTDESQSNSLVANTTPDFEVANREDESGNSTEAMSLPWRIFDYFLSQVSQTSVSPSTASSVERNETESATISIDIQPPVNESVATSDESVENNVTTTSPPITTTPAVTCDANQCREFSTDAILRARLCCLSEEVGQDGESTFGCRSYSKQTCDQMMPLIKCCLKDFSELLANFFHREGSTSNQRQRKASFAG